jgi:hypothetical protein
MKVLFAGPSLHGEIHEGAMARAPGIEVRGPAQQGDIVRAVRDGGAVIGLVDGLYENVAAPWHKEILFAIENGVTIMGGGSLGALRAAECAMFGMIGIGRIFEAYRDGERIDDSDVAQLHGPAELDYMPVTEALVNIDATVGAMLAAGLIGAHEAQRITSVAAAIFFKELSLEAVLERLGLDAEDQSRLEALYHVYRVDQKRQDALLLVETMMQTPDERQKPILSWTLSQPPVWRAFMATLEGTNLGK